jgi:hypothetical protein
VTARNTDEVTHTRWVLPLACSTVAVLATGLVFVSADAVKVAGGLVLLGAFASALWIAQRSRFVAIAPAIGLVLASLILIGLGLAAAHVLSTSFATPAIGVVTIAVAWAGSRRPEQPPRQRTAPRQFNLVAAAGAVFFVIAAAFAIHYSAVSAVSDSEQGTSLSVWAYPSGGRLHVGAEQPLGHGATSLRIVVGYPGANAATWNNVDLSPGQVWKAPLLALPRNGPIRVVALRGQDVVAALSVQSGPVRAAEGSAVTKKRRHGNRSHHHVRRHGSVTQAEEGGSGRSASS